MAHLQEIEVDNFAGGGGASLGSKNATGREPYLAINHDAIAIAVHKANHPRTHHRTEDVWKVSPEDAAGGRPIGLLWASPDCKHFSRAKGDKPVEKKIRSLAWVVVRWAIANKPRVIILENVREFEEWGPLLPAWRCKRCSWRGTEGQARLVRKRRRCPRCSLRLMETAEQLPDPRKKGITFRRFVGRLRALGYEVGWKVLNAADFGAPTHRRRLFLVARRDGQAIAWPEPTHGDPKRLDDMPLFASPRKPWRVAAECIDWNLPCPSIFDRKKPLAEASQRRIAFGIKRFVLDNPRPFLVVCNHGGEEFRGQPLDTPMRTLTAARDAHGLVTPYLARIGQTGGNGAYAGPVETPLSTITSKAAHLLVAPTLIQLGYGERPGQPPRALNIQEPLGTIVGARKHALVAGFCVKHFGGYERRAGVPIDTPLPTTTERGAQNQLVTANLVHFNHGAKQWSGADEPLRTITTGNHAFLVYSFLTKYFRTGVGAMPDEPLQTATGKDRFGLVYVTIAGETWVIVDIGMRMLTPRELARCQGFPDDYLLPGEQLQGKGYTKTAATKLIGNSVPPALAEAMIRANYTPERVVRRRRAAA